MEFGQDPEVRPITIRKQGPQTPVVVRAPSNDGAPWFSVHSTDDYHPFQPLYAIVIYATMPAAADPDFVGDLALKIHTGTIEERTERKFEGRDRIEVVGLPARAAGGTVDTDAAEACETEEDCVARCVAHYKAEVAARTATGQRAFFLPPTRDPDYDRRLTIIRSLRPGWEAAALFREKRVRPPGVRAGFGNPWDETAMPRGLRAPDPLGTILDVQWEATENLRWYYKQEAEAGLPATDVAEQIVRYVAVVRLAAQLASFRERLTTLGCYVYEGGLDTALRTGLAAATATKAKAARAHATAIRATADAAAIEAAEAAAAEAEAEAARAEASRAAFAAAMAARDKVSNVLYEKQDIAQKAQDSVCVLDQEVEAATAAGDDAVEAVRAKLAAAKAEAAEAVAAEEKASEVWNVKHEAVKAIVTWQPAP